MTTVVYRDGIIAADTLTSCGDEIADGVQKVGRTENYLFGYAGRYSSMRPVFKWVQMLDEKGVHPQDFYLHKDELMADDDGHVMLVNRQGKIWGLELEGFTLPFNKPWDAIGSGHRYAKGALVMGASAEEAVSAAGMFDAHSGGLVTSWSFDKPVYCPNEETA